MILVNVLYCYHVVFGVCRLVDVFGAFVEDATPARPPRHDAAFKAHMVNQIDLNGLISSHLKTIGRGLHQRNHQVSIQPQFTMQ